MHDILLILLGMWECVTLGFRHSIPNSIIENGRSTEISQKMLDSLLEYVPLPWFHTQVHARESATKQS